MRLLRPCAVRDGVTALPVDGPRPLCRVPSFLPAPLWARERTGGPGGWSTTHGPLFAAAVPLILLVPPSVARTVVYARTV
ncbi:hypothetical protein ACWGQ5_23880 [Streptomyces sp. NPDC055722]